MRLFPASAPRLKNLPPRRLFFWGSVAAALVLFSFLPVRAETVEELKSKIDARNQELEQLEEEIAKYEAELLKVGADKKTLEAEIARLDISRKKIATDIAVTGNRIATADLELDGLEKEISAKEKRIGESVDVIERSLRQILKIEDTTLVEHFLVGTSFSAAWEEADQERRMQITLRGEITELEAIREALRGDYAETEKKQGQLISFKKELSGQKYVLDQNRSQQSKVLGATKAKETEYETLLEAKRAARVQLESELREFEAQLEYTLDPSKIPAAGSGVLKFPLDANYIQRCAGRKDLFKNLYCITQYFGNTAFAQSGAYNGKGHNGTDFGAPEGTKVVSALSGIVQATGNTDEVRGCYSYGKWILVRHANGLSTLYAHLSHISVSNGEAIPTGGLLGYSGNTGYSTGPHLHFTVFAADAVRIVRFKDIKTITNCGPALVPVAPTAGYLNPLSYL